MAASQSKRSIHPTQARRPDPRKPAGRKTSKPSNRRSDGALHFPEARGRVVEDVGFFANASYNCVQLRFQDQTCLSLEFATGLAMRAYFARWKAGNERVVRRWPRVDSEPTF